MANEYIHVGQESLELRLDTGIDLSTAVTLKIKYTKPGGTSGSWDGTLYDTTHVKRDFLNNENELDEDGVWSFWSWADMADGRSIAGKPVQYYVKVEGVL